jgi:hypothetical protein
MLAILNVGRLVRRYFRYLGCADYIIVSFLFFFSQIILTETLLGLLGKLSLGNLFFLNLVIFILVRSAIRTVSGKPSVRIFPEDFFSDKVLVFCLVSILGFAIVKAGINLVNPPFGWDCLNYHFTFPVEWIRQARLDNPITISDDPSPSYYPINGSLFFLWLILPFRSVFLADLGQIPFFILGFLAVYSIGKKIKLSQKYAFLAGCLFTLIPNYFKQIEIAYVDVMVSALFLASLNFLLSVNEKFSWQNVLAFSVGLGLLSGTKTLALVYSLLLIIPFVYLAIRNINKFYLFTIFIFCLLSLGGFSYIKNFLETHNPLYPLNFNIFGRTIFKGVMENSVYRMRFKAEDYSLAKLLFHEGLGLQSLLFILPGIFVALPLGIMKRRKSLNFLSIYVLILPLLIYLVYRYIIPLANTRYLYAGLGIGSLVGFYIIQMLNIPEKIVKSLVVISVLASVSELAKYGELITSLILTAVLFMGANLLMRGIRLNLLIKKPLWFCSVIACLFLILTFLEKDYVRNEFPRYIKSEQYSGFWPDATRSWEWLNKNTNGDNVAYVGRPVPFPLYGTHFKNNVFYVSVNKTEPAKLHYFPTSHYAWDYNFFSLHRNLEAKGNYRENADYYTWLNNLSRRNADYLFVYSLHQTEQIEFPVEDRWAGTHPEIFRLVFRNETIHIYRIMR